ncbi:hypothetical protein FE782_01995 [Paenibacillus antri]|uniref:Uncharacterized protein n=1 Tax=Paenibacillus antri TaxID=2582848 RepID=A0A5R9GIK3_9BACL|nr:hypothetical protein [Paenibacillus antri]TLS54140.1 hypothetical protein FE782_01995 [Paenibacillus antri]
MTFLIIATVLAIAYLLIARWLRADLFRCLLVVSLLSLFVTLHLGLNYVGSMADNPEGIGLTSSYLLWIFGDSNWSTYRFGNAFRISSWISFVLLIALAGTALVRKRD